jgi:hypothetical protein
MSMIGEYARLTPAELKRAIDDPGWAQEYVEVLAEVGWDKHKETRCHDVDKAWDTLGFLLRRIEFPVDIVQGEQEIPGVDDWGYGPPRYLTPERVKAAAAALGALSSEALVRGVTEAELVKAELYPNIPGKELRLLTFAARHYDGLVPYFQAAAADGHAIVVWLG